MKAKAMSAFKTATGYIYSESEQVACNKQGLNYWYKYTEEIFDELGLAAEKVEVDQVLDNKLNGLKYLVAGNIELSSATMETIKKWINDGGILVCFGTTGAVEKLGIKRVAYEKQADDEYTIFKYCSFDEPVMSKYLPVPEKDILLPVISDVVRVKAIDCEVLGKYIDPQNSGRFRVETGWPAVLKKSLGKGYIYYFSFNLPQTICTLHQGRPVDRDYNGDGIYQAFDGIVLNKGMNIEIPFGDYWLIFLQNILTSGAPQVFIHQLPPNEYGNASDFTLYYGGDDEGSKGIQVPASDFMKSRGLPYHINAMEKKEGFGLLKEEYDYIKNTNQHEISIHFDFIKAYNHYTESDMKQQADRYAEYYGEIPVVSVNHCSTFTGWAEHARWSVKCGIKGDNTRFPGMVYPVVNPMNHYGFGFGTAYPHFVYEDYLHDNRKMDFVYLPISYFEPRIYSGENHDASMKKLHDVLDNAKHHARTINMFIHPVYIVRTKECVDAVDEIMKYIREKNYSVVHMGCDELCLWWMDRSGSTVGDIQFEDRTEGDVTIIRFKADIRGNRGMTLKLPLNDGIQSSTGCLIDGALSKHEVKYISGRKHLLLNVLPGEHNIEIKL